MLPESRIFDYEISAGAGGASNGLHGSNSYKGGLEKAQSAVTLGKMAGYGFASNPPYEA